MTDKPTKRAADGQKLETNALPKPSDDPQGVRRNAKLKRQRRTSEQLLEKR